MSTIAIKIAQELTENHDGFSPIEVETDPARYSQYSPWMRWECTCGEIVGELTSDPRSRERYAAQVEHWAEVIDRITEGTIP